ncbi:MAG: peptidoglycan-associated lipoprotein Pal [Paracoccaceae bacterium]|nr:peptidoglycan-associated lipoprotein Pal [Paracoccaceae bacterium]
MIRRLTGMLLAVALAGCAANSGNDSGQAGMRSGEISEQALGGVGAEPGSIAYFQALTGDRVFFEVDESTLSAEAVSILDAQVEWLSVHRQYTATVEGHADERGTREYNLALGVRRAVSVRNYLVSQGIAADRIAIVTFGKERPVETCSNEFCWSVNRRAVTVLAEAAVS